MLTLNAFRSSCLKHVETSESKRFSDVASKICCFFSFFFEHMWNIRMNFSWIKKWNQQRTQNQNEIFALFCQRLRGNASEIRYRASKYYTIRFLLDWHFTSTTWTRSRRISAFISISQCFNWRRSKLCEYSHCDCQMLWCGVRAFVAIVNSVFEMRDQWLGCGYQIAAILLSSRAEQSLIKLNFWHANTHSDENATIKNEYIGIWWIVLFRMTYFVICICHDSTCC